MILGGAIQTSETIEQLATKTPSVIVVTLYFNIMLKWFVTSSVLILINSRTNRLSCLSSKINMLVTSGLLYSGRSVSAAINMAKGRTKVHSNIYARFHDYMS